MSVSSYQNEVIRLQEKISGLRLKIASENRQLASISSDITSLTRSLGSASSLSSLTSYASRIDSKQADSARVQKKIGDLEKDVANRMGELARAQENLSRAQDQERKKQDQEATKRDAEALKRSEEQLKRSREQTQEFQKQAVIQSHLRRQAMLDLNQLPEKIKVLFCAADPKNGRPLALDEEVRAIGAQIRAAKHRESVELDSIWAVRSIDLLQALNEKQPHVVHFSGHGSEEDDIVFLDEQGRAKFVSKAAIVSILASAASNLRVVVFNTCFSKNQAEEITQHVEAAIGMSTSIGDKAARNFSAQFYSAIGFGLSVQQAFDQAKAFLMAENSDEAQTPVLFTKEGIDASQIILVKP